MGFVLSILYFVTYYLTPATMFGPLAQYRIQLILGTILLLVSLPKLREPILLKASQTVALIGLAVAVSLSVLFGMGWVGGAVQAFFGFLPNSGFGYFLICLHCNTKRRLQILVVMLMFVCLFVIAHGGIEMLDEAPGDGSPISSSVESAELSRWKMEHPYLFIMENETGKGFYRLMGQGEINDPNDFGQLLVCVMPLIFIFWRTKKMIRNVAFVGLPASVLLIGIFLTHSRGALLGLTVMAVVAARRRIGTVRAFLIGVGLYVAAMAMHFTGGRGISASAGEDRTSLWGASLQVFRSHPLFGIGIGSLPDYIGLTAHNSVAVCAAEIGIFGLFFWCMYLYSTVRDVVVVASPRYVSVGVATVEEPELYPGATRTMDSIDTTEINRFGSLLVLSVVGFLVTGWFLSRAFAMTWFVLGGIIETVYEMALQRGMVVSRLRMARLLPYSGLLTMSLLIGLYVIVRILNVMH